MVFIGYFVVQFNDLRLKSQDGKKQESRQGEENQDRKSQESRQEEENLSLLALDSFYLGS